LEALADAEGYIEPSRLLEFGAAVPKFDQALEDEVVARGWSREKPSAAVGRWTARAAIALVVGLVAGFAGLNLPSNGLLLVGVAIVVGAVVMGVLARSMPAVSLMGAMIRAMLAAYRRTLKKTMDQARSMEQVVAEGGLCGVRARAPDVRVRRRGRPVVARDTGPGGRVGHRARAPRGDRAGAQPQPRGRARR